MRTTLQHLFTPHHTNNYRARILQPAGLTVIVALFVLSQSLVRLTELSGLLPTGYILGYASNITAQQTIEQTNSQRASQGLPPLQANAQLTQAAIAKANHMFANNYWAHVAPDGTTPWVFIKNSGYGYAVAGENLARDFDTTGSMLSAWMASPTHKDNIMHQKYAEIGVGVVNGTLEGVETTLVVQMFGQPSRAAAQTSPTAVKTEVAAVPAEQTAATQPTKIPTLAPTTAIAASPTALPRLPKLQRHWRQQTHPPMRLITNFWDPLLACVNQQPKRDSGIATVDIESCERLNCLFASLGVALRSIFYSSRQNTTTGG
jgi:hypothetical protein